LRNHRYGYRLRVGRYRVLFDHVDVIRIIKIQEVKKRDERTY
jgi:mRNA-degrading endonuclease RelE of RelBE toxin-antitoxin system